MCHTYRNIAMDKFPKFKHEEDYGFLTWSPRFCTSDYNDRNIEVADILNGLKIENIEDAIPDNPPPMGESY